jgi:hypothetical protein
VNDLSTLNCVETTAFNRRGRIPIDRDEDEGRRGKQPKSGFNKDKKKKQIGTADERG